tara:strand:+ start:1591 stop:1764 length:174 start_codon:yes stop_codon:yes gene_type:complete
MAVPKKRKSKAKRNSRKAVWKRKVEKEAKKSYSLSKAFEQGKPTSFIYRVFDEDIDS